MKVMKLKEICDLKSGSTPRRGNKEYWSNGTIPWAKISDLETSTDGCIYDTEEYISEKGLESINNRFFKKGTLLFAMYGSVGKTAITKIDLTMNQAILGINIKDDTVVDLNYLQYLLSIRKEQLLNRAVGVTLKNLSKTIVQDLKIPLPDLATQKAIAARLDQAEAVKTHNQQLLAKYDQLAQSIFLEMFGDPVVNEKGWEKKKLGEFGKWKSGGTPSRKIKNYFRGDIPWLSSGELNNKFVNTSKEFITEQAIEESAASKVEKGSLFLGMYDTAALKSSINIVEVSCNQAIAFSKLSNINTEFVYHLIQLGKEYFRSKQRGVRQKNMNLTMIKSLEIINPPLKLQTEFTRRIKNIEQQKVLLREEIEKSDELFQSLLQESFRFEEGINTPVRPAADHPS